MMHDPQSQSFDPDRVLQQVWQNDYPNTWRVFYGSETIISNVLSSLFPLIVVDVILGISTCYNFVMLASTSGTGVNSGSSPTSAMTSLLLFVVLVGVTIFFSIRNKVKERRTQQKLRQQPNPTLVVLPDRVVAYRRQQIRSLNFAEVAYMRLRVQANTETVTTTTPSTSTVPAAPSIWLDLSFYDGRRDAWSIDIDPQDMIAQCILDAYNTYRVTKER